MKNPAGVVVGNEQATIDLLFFNIETTPPVRLAKGLWTSKVAKFPVELRAFRARPFRESLLQCVCCFFRLAICKRKRGAGHHKFGQRAEDADSGSLSREVLPNQRFEGFRLRQYGERRDLFGDALQEDQRADGCFLAIGQQAVPGAAKDTDISIPSGPPSFGEICACQVPEWGAMVNVVVALCRGSPRWRAVEK